MALVFPLTTALTIATSDSSGGAGIQADLKTFAALGVYGVSAICSITAQNTLGVTAMESVSPSLVQAQLATVWDDLPPLAVKIGLIGPAALVQAVAIFLKERAQNTPVVLDPVMVSASGHVFLAPSDVAGLKTLLPLATLLTPNLPEAEVLSGLKISDSSSLKRAGEILLAQGPRYVLIKGGHLAGPNCDDHLFGPEGQIVFPGPRIDSRNTHGTGCTLSSAIAAFLAQGKKLAEAIKAAKDYVTAAFLTAPALGQGPGPLNHFHPYYAYGQISL
jgi:hydroxymethylpyrimidine/phosphomethylpyrimidine kinase